ncbi:hypothetical protein PGN35_012150 [Nodosilinea sp. PGN35]|uniref:hypothetical protein n=1 Tax=Nodosilinea sp. PGN35 TaxID=3020489 RepID=UPI0023B2F5D6|nr:hypothetical protein [Nodosilinea sp. TSF1-S3]MDF0368689.1 hypothetical protein [Nodosilinea sp. TSF1-S3]
MRVWALASCSGLLALAACSAEQSSSPNPSAVPLDGEDAAVETQRGLIAVASSPMARPEVRPRPTIGGYRLSAAAGHPAATTARGKALPQAAELRQRLERLRSQQGRLSSATPLVTAPQPATLARPTLSQSRPASPAAEPGSPAFNPVRGSNLSTQGIAPLPTPFRPTPIDSEATIPEATIPTASAAADLGEVTAARVAQTYPIAPLRHQGYSTRAQQPAPVLSVARSGAEFPTARLHGGVLTTQQTDAVSPAGAIAASVAIVDGSASPGFTPGSVREAATNTSAPDLALGSESPGPEPGLGRSELELQPASPAAAPLTVDSHQSSGPVALAPTASLNGEISREAHQSQGVSTGATSAPVSQSTGLWASGPAAAGPEVTPPESLPLNPPPRLRPELSEVVTVPEVAAEMDDSTAREQILVPSAAQIVAPASALPDPDGQTAAAALGEAAAPPELHHQSQSSADGVRLIPTASQPPKGLALGYCLSPSGQIVPTALEAAPETAPETPGAAAPLPKFSTSSAADAGLGLGSALAKDAAAEPCVGLSPPELATEPSPEAPPQP